MIIFKVSKLTLCKFNGNGIGFLLKFDSSGTPSSRLSISGTCLLFRDPELFLLNQLDFPCWISESLPSVSSLDMWCEYPLLVPPYSLSGMPKFKPPMWLGDGWLDDDKESVRSRSPPISIGLTSRLFILPVDFTDFREFRFVTIPFTLLHADLFLPFSNCWIRFGPRINSPSSDWLLRSSSW